MSNYICQRCGTDWEGAPGHPKSYCDVIFNEAEVKRLNLQKSELEDKLRAKEGYVADLEEQTKSLRGVVTEKNRLIDECVKAAKEAKQMLLDQGYRLNAGVMRELDKITILRMDPCIQQSQRKCSSRMPGTARNNVIECVLGDGHAGEHKDPVGIHWGR